MKSVVVLSGGLDSTTCLHYIAKESKEEVYPLAFNYGQKHNIELEMAKWQVKNIQSINSVLVKPLQIINMSFMKELLGQSNALTSDDVEVPTLEEVIGEPQPISYVPNRNMVFLSIALSYAEAVNAKRIYYGAQKHDEYSGYWDTTLYFVERINKVAALNRKNEIKIIAPFVNLSKAEEIIIGQKLDIDYNKTWTSYKVEWQGDKPIADYYNPTSRDRIKAFATVGIKDPITYNKSINWNNLILKHKKDFSYSAILYKINESIRNQFIDKEEN